MFCIFYDASTKKVHSLNGSGRSPANLSLAGLRKELKIEEGQDGSIPISSVHSATVPGAAAGWADTVERFGSGKLKLSDVLKPAIDMAEGGYPISQITAYFVSDFIRKIGRTVLKDLCSGLEVSAESSQLRQMGARF